MPLFYRDYPMVDGCRTTDGGVADAIPVGEAIHRGAYRIMVIRSRRRDYVKRQGLFDFFMRWCVRRYPMLQQAMARRVRHYNESVALIRKPPYGVSIVEVCPPENFRVSRLSQDRPILKEGYEQGRSMAVEAIARWKSV
jgi:predicted patatin/cPLA2 family phospholipase